MQTENNQEQHEHGTLNQGDKAEALQKELDTLKASYTDLEGRYNTLNGEYSQYKFDIEFNKDISQINYKLDDEQRDTLRSLKSSNDKAYKMLLDSFTKALNTGSIGNYGRGFNPAEQQEIKNKNNDDAFTQAIKERKGQ